jgi:hypothetical protein
MSTHEQLEQEEDTINTPFIVVVGVVSLILFAIGVFWALKIQKAEMGTIVNGTAPRPTEVGKREIGIVFQPLFDATEIAHEENKPSVERIMSYGWAEPSKQFAHVPIEQAMKMFVEKGKL